MFKRLASSTHAPLTRTPLALAVAALGMLCAPAATGQQPVDAAATTATAPAKAKTTKAKSTVAAKPKSHSAALKSTTPVTINFVNADIDAVTRAMGAMLDRQFVVDPRVKGTITVYSDQPMLVREAYLNYLAALRGLGFTVVETAGLLKIVPEADAKLQAGTVDVGNVRTRGDQVVTQIFRLNHENPNNLVPVLRPLISPNNTINANAGNQTLVITDYADNLQRISKIIAALDNAGTPDPEVVQLKHGVALDMATLVQKLAGGGGGGGAPGVPAIAGSSLSVTADPRSNSLIVQAPSAAKLAQVKGIIEQLDQPTRGNGGPGGNIWVVHLKNQDAVRLATILRAAFANPQQGGAGAAAGTPTAPTTSPGSTIGSAQGGAGGTVASTPLQGAAGVQTGGFIQADPATNSLIITAAEPMYRQIRAVIDQLDSRRAQVFVESMIVKVDANKAADFGVQWQGILGSNSKNNGLVAGTNFSTAGSGNNILTLSAAGATNNAAAIGGVGAGLNLGLLHKIGGAYTLASLARFLESNTGANILSTPTLMALDNEEAQIVIGQNVPFITGSYVNTGGTSTAISNPFQTIERKDVGLTLRVKSQIGEGGTVRMTIYQENSAVVPGATTTAGPTTDKSAITTSVVVDDGQIIVLGGLFKDEYTDGDDKIPGLGDVPLAGNLFKAQNRKRVKTNLMVFLRPVVIRDASAADSLTLDRYESIRAQQRNTQPPTNGIGTTPEGPMIPPLQAPTIVPPGVQPVRPKVQGATPADAATAPSGAAVTTPVKP